MKRLLRFLRQLWPWRWFRAALALTRGVRLHPTAVLLGGAQQFEIGRGAVIGPRVRLDPGAGGHVVLGEKVWFAADTEIETGTMVRIGGGTTVQRRCSINGSTRIGRGCILAPNVFVSSGTHPFRAYPHLPIREQEKRLAAAPLRAAGLDKPVWIQDDCWLGVNSVICPGVTVGKGSIVGANAVVTRDVPPYTVVAGSPARVIGQRMVWQPANKILANQEEDLVYVLAASSIRRLDSRSCEVEVAAGDVLRVAMAAPCERIRVYYRATRSINVRVFGVIYALTRGVGFVDFPGMGMSVENDVALLDIEVVSEANGAPLWISAFETLEGAAGSGS